MITAAGAESRAEPSVEVVGEIGQGLCVLVGVTHTDGPTEAAKLADKIWHLRVMEDDQGVMNRSIADTTQAVLVVSQFTLYGDTKKGRRPSFFDALEPAAAASLVDAFVAQALAKGFRVETGRFGAHMRVELVNDGPVTLWLDSRTP